MIFIDTNVISENMRKTPDEAVQSWLKRFDPDLAVSSIVIGELAFSIDRITAEQRSPKLKQGLEEWRERLQGRILPFTEDAALIYGKLMGDAVRRGREMSVQDGMIAATALVNRGKLATRNIRHFDGIGLELINPWNY